MTAPHQLLLNLKPDWTPTLDNYIAGTNRELISRLRNLASPRGFDAIYLWGSEGSGKSHLLTAIANLASQQRTISRHDAYAAPAGLTPPAGTLLLIDDIQNLSAEAQIGLFNAFNAARRLGLALLLTGPCPPLQLALREDLRTRIGQCLIYEIHPLSDEEKKSALHHHALLRGMRLDASVIDYLLRHGRRDLPSLMSMLDALDHSSLAQKRQATLPLLRELMHPSPEPDAK